MPDAYKEILDVRIKLEKHFKDMQDFEFTVENNKLYMLQTRNGKRTGLAAVRIAVELNKKNLSTKRQHLRKSLRIQSQVYWLPYLIKQSSKRLKHLLTVFLPVLVQPLVEFASLLKKQKVLWLKAVMQFFAG